jgi:hypothetical protein
MDTPSRGRSAPDMTVPHTQYSTGFVEQWFTAPEASSNWPQAALHTQWPGVSGNLLLQITTQPVWLILPVLKSEAFWLMMIPRPGAGVTRYSMRSTRQLIQV